MKQKYLVLMCMLICTTVSTYSQSKSGKVEIIAGKDFYKPMCDEHLYFGKDESSFYFTGDCSKTEIQKHDKNMTLIKSEEISFKKDKVYKDRLLLFLRYYNDKIYAFSASDIKVKGQIVSTIFAETFDKNSLLPNNDVTKLDVITTGKQKVSASYSIMASPDRSKFLVAYNVPLADEKEIVKYRFLVFDKNFKPLWEKEQTLHCTAENFHNDGMKIDNNSTIALSYNLINEDKKSYMFFEKHILVLSNNGKESKDYIISPEGKKPSSIITVFDKDGSIVCSGFYTEKGWNFGKGWYFMRINPQTKEVMSAKTGAFEKSFISNFSGDKSADNAKCVYQKDDAPELESYSADKLQFLDNGSMVLITQQHYETTRTDVYSDRAGRDETREVMTYYFNDIIAVSISPEGNMQWVKRIPKLQKMIDDDYGSYFYAFANNQLHFLYTWFPSSQKAKPDEKMISLRYDSYSVYHVTIDAAGNLATEEIFTLTKLAKDDYNLFHPGYEQISDNELLLLGRNLEITKRKWMKFKFNP